jgi:pyruvate/2-oxoglutarate dehydrogenase complex dihydrolipoamide dehydrogenase (E3) component
VDIRAETSVVHIQARSQGIGVTVARGEAQERLDISHILVAAGRRPNVETLALDKARIALTAGEGRLKLTSGLRTSNGRVYAVGDVSGGDFSAQRAAWQADMVVRSALLGLPRRSEPALVPRALYTDPGLVEVGLSEPMARRRPAARFEILRAGFAENDRARAERDTQGLVKLVLDHGGRLLGAGIAGPEAGELGALFALAVSSRLTMAQLAAFAAPHPSYGAIARALGSAHAGAKGPTPLMQRLLRVNRLLP